MHAKTTGGHGIGSPCKPPSRVQRVRSAIRDDGAAGTGAKSNPGEHSSTRFGARTRMFEAGFGRSQGWRRPKCRLLRSVRPVGRDEGTREAGGLPGEKTFGVICQRERSFQSHSPQPEGRAKSCRGQRPRVLHGEAMPIRREGRCQPSGRPQKNRSPMAAVFLLAQPVVTNRATGLRHGASWSCRRCLPARCPSR